MDYPTAERPLSPSIVFSTLYPTFVRSIFHLHEIHQLSIIIDITIKKITGLTLIAQTIHSPPGPGQFLIKKKGFFQDDQVNEIIALKPSDS